MSYYAPPIPSSARPRPSIVTAAGYLLYAVAGLYAVNGIISIATIGKIMNAAGLQSETTDTQDLKSVVEFASVFSAVFELIIVALFVVLGVFVLRGRNGMRITTWVIAGVGALCTLCGAVSGGASAMFTDSADGVSSAQSDAVQNALPGWARASSILIDVLIMIALCVVIILLALRSSNEYFRKTAPMMIVGYPGYPAYPSTGYPSTGSSGGAYPGYPATGYPTPGYQGWVPPQGQPGDQMYPYPPAPVPPTAPDSPWALPGGAPTDAEPTRQDPDRT